MRLGIPFAWRSEHGENGTAFVWGEERNASVAMSCRVVDCVRGNVGGGRGSRPGAAFARLPQLSGFDVSPSGKRVLMFQPTGDSLHLVVMDLEARTSRLALASDPERFFFNWCVFDADDRIVCSVRRLHRTGRRSEQRVPGAPIREFARDGHATVRASIPTAGISPSWFRIR